MVPEVTNEKKGSIPLATSQCTDESDEVLHDRWLC